MAKQLECDEDGAASEEKLRQIAQHELEPLCTIPDAPRALAEMRAA